MVTGGEEPRWMRVARDAYWRSLLEQRQLEARIAQTLAGQAWLDRLKQRLKHS